MWFFVYGIRVVGWKIIKRIHVNTFEIYQGWNVRTKQLQWGYCGSNKQSLVKIERGKRTQVFSEAVRGTDYFYSIFSCGSYICVPLDWILSLKSHLKLRVSRRGQLFNMIRVHLMSAFGDGETLLGWLCRY